MAFLLQLAQPIDCARVYLSRGTLAILRRLMILATLLNYDKICTLCPVGKMKVDVNWCLMHATDGSQQCCNWAHLLSR